MVSIVVHGVEKNGMVTLLVMSHFSHSQVPQGVPLLFVIQLRFPGSSIRGIFRYSDNNNTGSDRSPDVRRPACRTRQLGLNYRYDWQS
ncbi:hypothetical protein [Sedimenticola hydrogenitrophicus]|uniref:hypothetical protein n=1 Tax=Sedimenticola hydrogenitrophicus TaxID=2967975 RepID=UPI0021A283B1|nr:hypothetical protein [Sedimenticola hydrogenitrophicus]